MQATPELSFLFLSYSKNVYHSYVLDKIFTFAKKKRKIIIIIKSDITTYKSYKRWRMTYNKVLKNRLMDFDDLLELKPK